MRQRSLAVIAGGMGTNQEYLDTVGNAVVDAGLANDAAVYSLKKARRNPDWLSGNLREAAISVGHSIGNMILDGAIRADAHPEIAVACNGTEQMSYLEMVRRGQEKRRQARSDEEIGQIYGDNMQDFRRHPFINAAVLPGMRRFSTFASLARCQKMGMQALAVVTTGDILTPYNPQLRPEGIDVLELPGHHDELLLSPYTVMYAVADRLGKA